MKAQSKYADQQLSEAIAAAQGNMFGKLMKPKSRLEVCSVMAWMDDELGELEVYYRVDNLYLSNQTDESRDAYMIECIKMDGEEIRIAGRLEQEILDHLNFNDPLKRFV